MKKVALVTGASSGIGKETAKLLVQNGYTVYGAARRVEKMADIEKDGVKLIAMDVTDEASMVSGVNEILQTEKRIYFWLSPTDAVGFANYARTTFG
jgi:NADP-dependent 3-hydroxy acid dehydrogenase YdfG